MGPNPQFSFSIYNTINNLDLHPKLKALLHYSLYNRRPPRDLFDNINSYYYYISYVKPKVVRVLKDRSSRLNVYISPHYLLYDIRLYYKYHGRAYHYYYIFGIDNDKVFVNRVNGPTDFYTTIAQFDNIEFRLINDNLMHIIMGYHIDLGDKEDTTIEFTTNIRFVRIQGDLMLELIPLDENTNTLGRFIDSRRILEHVELLLLDLINRILIDYGLSTNVTRNNTLVLNSIAPRDNDRYYLNKLFKLLVKELKEIGEIEYNENEYTITPKFGFNNCFINCFRLGGGFSNPYNHLGVSVSCGVWGDIGVITRELNREIIEALSNLPPSIYEFNIGNHYVKINNTKSLSFSYRPSKQPLTLNENTINIINPLTFIVTPNTSIELIHREHGLKTVRFGNNYIVRFTHVSTHNDYLRERNRVILRNLEL
jgi:hypothetical protein